MERQAHERKSLEETLTHSVSIGKFINLFFFLVGTEKYSLL